MSFVAKVGRTGAQAVFITRLRSIALGCTTALLFVPRGGIEPHPLSQARTFVHRRRFALVPAFRGFSGMRELETRKMSSDDMRMLHPLGHAAACLSSISLALAPQISAYCLVPSRQWQSEDTPSPSHAPLHPRPLHVPAPWATGTRKSSAKRE